MAPNGQINVLFPIYLCTLHYVLPADSPTVLSLEIKSFHEVVK